MMNLRGQRGFSLIQVLVASSLMVILIMAFVSFLNFATKGQKNVQNSVDFDIIKTSMNMVFNTRACDGSLYKNATDNIEFILPAGMTLGDNLLSGASKIDIYEVRHGDSKVVRLGESVMGGLKINRLEVTDAIYDGDQVVDGVKYKAFAARIFIEVTKPTGSLGAKTLSSTMSVRLLAIGAGANQGKVNRCQNSFMSHLGMTDQGGFYIDDDATTLPAGSDQAAALQAHKSCSDKGLRLCSASEVVVACANNFITPESIPDSPGGYCVEADVANTAFFQKANCNGSNSKFGGQWGLCAGAQYRCCVDKYSN